MAAKVRIRFPRANAMPDGICFEVLTNGTIEANGDLVPNANPLADPALVLTAKPIEVWPVGKAGEGLGQAGMDPAGNSGNTVPGYGAGLEAAGYEEAGFYGDFVSWETPMPVRDGNYIFAVRTTDRYGTAQGDPLVTAVLAVAGDPRAPMSLRFVSWSAGNLNLSWLHSPDLA